MHICMLGIESVLEGNPSPYKDQVSSSNRIVELSLVANRRTIGVQFFEFSSLLHPVVLM